VTGFGIASANRSKMAKRLSLFIVSGRDVFSMMIISTKKTKFKVLLL
jgi:hypothetical protein